MIELGLNIFFAYKNAQLAKAKGLNTVVWVILTIVAFFFAYVMGMGLLISIFYNGPLEPDALMQFTLERPLFVVTAWVLGSGGYLLVRFILEKTPSKLQQ